MSELERNPIGLIKPTRGPSGPRPIPLLEVRVAKIDRPLIVRCLSQTPWWFDVHWIEPPGKKGRTVPHIDDPLRCAGCLEGSEIRSLAFLAAEEPDTHARCIAQLNRLGAMASASIQQFDGDLRGRILKGELGRKPTPEGHGRSKYVVLPAKHTGPLQPDFAVPFYLLRMWGYSQMLREWLKSGKKAPWLEPAQPSLAAPFEQEPPP